MPLQAPLHLNLWCLKMSQVVPKPVKTKQTHLKGITTIHSCMNPCLKRKLSKNKKRKTSWTSMETNLTISTTSIRCLMATITTVLMSSKMMMKCRLNLTSKYALLLMKRTTVTVINQIKMTLRFKYRTDQDKVKVNNRVMKILWKRMMGNTMS